MAAQPGQRATITDVARVAGVSRGTVSRVLNGGKWVSEDAAKAVRQAIAKTGYVASPSARQLRTGRSHIVAFLVDDSPAAFFGDPNVETIVSDLSDALAGEDMSLVLLMAGGQAQARRALEFVRSGSVAGVVSVSARPSTLRSLVDTGVPVVNCGIPQDHADEVGYVTADEVSGGRLMGEHLVARGARRIGIIGGPADSPGGTVRVDAFRQAVGDRLVEGAVRVGDYRRESGRRLGAELLDAYPDLDAIWAASDLMAAGVLEELKARGLFVPGDIMLAGFDDSAAARACEPTLTTMHQPFDVISRELVHVLMRRINDGVRASVTVPVSLVEGDSTRR